MSLIGRSSVAGLTSHLRRLVGLLVWYIMLQVTGSDEPARFHGQTAPVGQFRVDATMNNGITMQIHGMEEEGVVVVVVDANTTIVHHSLMMVVYRQGKDIGRLGAGGRCFPNNLGIESWA